jgi:cytochrome b
MSGVQRVQLWDAPLRVFHWALLASVGTAIVTGKLGGDWMAVHGKAGIVTAGLLGFRLVWGLIGSDTSRFAHFFPTPGRILSYLRGQWRGIGHNPLGALSVFALLGLLTVQTATGLVGNDDIAFTGPLVDWVQEAVSLKATGWHRQLAVVLYVLLGLHVAAIGFYAAVKKQRLVPAMVTGQKDIPADLPPPRGAHRLATIVAVAAGLALSYGASGAWVRHFAVKPTPLIGITEASDASPASPAGTPYSLNT